jgi:hypothetical protein
MLGALPPFPVYHFTSWYLVKHGDFTLPRLQNCAPHSSEDDLTALLVVRLGMRLGTSGIYQTDLYVVFVFVFVFVFSARAR